MNKLKLDPDALLVESFAPTSDAAAGLGTVHGRGYAIARDKPTLDHTDCPIYSCTCSNGAPFTECDCDPAVPDLYVAG